MSWYNSSVAKARQEDTPRNPVILATCQVIAYFLGHPDRIGPKSVVTMQVEIA